MIVPRGRWIWLTGMGEKRCELGVTHLGLIDPETI
jgi:hypothetical protein